MDKKNSSERQGSEDEVDEVGGLETSDNLEQGEIDLGGEDDGEEEDSEFSLNLEDLFEEEEEEEELKLHEHPVDEIDLEVRSPRQSGREREVESQERSPIRRWKSVATILVLLGVALLLVGIYAGVVIQKKKGVLGGTSHENLEAALAHIEGLEEKVEDLSVDLDKARKIEPDLRAAQSRIGLLETKILQANSKKDKAKHELADANRERESAVREASRATKELTDSREEIIKKTEEAEQELADARRVARETIDSAEQQAKGLLEEARSRLEEARNNAIKIGTGVPITAKGRSKARIAELSQEFGLDSAMLARVTDLELNALRIKRFAEEALDREKKEHDKTKRELGRTKKERDRANATLSKRATGGSPDVLNAVAFVDGSVVSNGSNVTVKQGDKISFDGSASAGTIKEYRWKFGDGLHWPKGAIVDHTYGSLGTFNAELTVVGDPKGTHTLTFKVKVK